MRYVIASERPWYSDMANALRERTGHEFSFIDNRSKLTISYLAALNPRYVFFPHWSQKIPEEIYERFECVIFHMTDLPYGRGGSPLQNLIVRGINDTKISAIRCARELDAGPVYLKRDFRLDGSAEEIFQRAAKAIEGMIEYLVLHELTPAEQSGDVVVFKRRRPEESNMTPLSNLDQVYNYIRMLDAEGYPYAFIETEHLRFEFRRASRTNDSVTANVVITQKRSW